MDAKRRRLMRNLVIIFGPVLLIMAALTLGLVDVATLGRWDISISIGALVTVLIFLMIRDKQ